MEDLKRSLGTTEKPDITHVRKPIMVAIARACEYGSAKYERSNFLREQDDAKGDFLRFRSYLRACLSHVVETLDSMEQHQANDPSLLDVEGMDRAAYAADTDPDTTGKVGPSGLPHVYGAAASLMMAISQATQGGLLPDDAGQPWAKVRSEDITVTAERVGKVTTGTWDMPRKSEGVCVSDALVAQFGEGTKQPAETPDPDLKPWQCRRPTAEALADPEAPCGCVGCVRVKGPGGFPGTYRQANPNWGFAHCDRCSRSHNEHLPIGECPSIKSAKPSDDLIGGAKQSADSPPDPGPGRFESSDLPGSPYHCRWCHYIEELHTVDKSECPT